MFRLTAVIASIILFAGCGQEPAERGAPSVPDDRVVIEVEGMTVTAGRLAPLLEDFRGDSLMIERVVGNLVNRFLILQDARDRGLDTTRSFTLYAFEREREKLQSMWLDWILARKVQLPPGTVEEYYSRLGEMVIYTAITVEDGDQADSLRRLISEGRDINLLASEHTIGMMERAREGRMGPIDRMEVRPDDAGLLAGLEPGDLSPVDSVAEGWRFLRLDSAYSEPPAPLEEQRDIMEGRILGRMRMDYKDILFDSLRTANDFRIEDDIPDLIASHFLRGAREYEPFAPEEEEMTAYSYRGGSRTVYQLAENIRSLPPVQGTDPSDPAWVKQYSMLIGLYDLMAMEARALGMDTLPEVRAYMDLRLSNHLLDIYHERVIEPSLVPDEGYMLEVYEASRDSLVVPESRIFRVISAVGEAQLGLLEATLHSGGNPFRLNGELTPVQSLLAPGELTLTAPMYAAEVPQPYRDIIFSAGMNETVICTVSSDRVMVFMPVEIMPGHPATFEESYDEIYALIRFEMEEEMLAVLVDSLASVYHIEIDREFVDSFIHPAPAPQDELQ